MVLKFLTPIFIVRRHMAYCSVCEIKNYLNKINSRKVSAKWNTQKQRLFFLRCTFAMKVKILNSQVGSIILKDSVTASPVTQLYWLVLACQKVGGSS